MNDIVIGLFANDVIMIGSVRADWPAPFSVTIEDSHVTSDGHVTSWYTPYWRSSHQCQAISEMRIIHVDMCVKRLG